MTRFISAIRYSLIFILLVSLSGGCAAKKKADREQTGPAVLLERGIRQMNDGSFASAARTLQLVKDRYPYSEEAIAASLKLADTVYKRNEYDVAYNLYSEFEKLYPKNESAPYVAYKMGMCYFERVRTFDRDQTYTSRAREEFERFINRYPDSEYTAGAARNLRECMISLAQHELYVANFYFKNRQYGPALESW